MAEQQKYAILDTDFVSKANIIKTENHVLADEVLAFPGYSFFCHQKMKEELEDHGGREAQAWLESKIESGEIVCYSDDKILSEMSRYIQNSCFSYYRSFLKQGCNIFDTEFYSQYFLSLDEMMDAGEYDQELFLTVLHSCENQIGHQKSYGEIKAYVLAQTIKFLYHTEAYIFCSDDFGARQGFANGAQIPCISILSVFLKFYLMGKMMGEVEPYFQSFLRWCFDRKNPQTHVKVWIFKDGSNKREKVPLEFVLHDIYEGLYYARKDGDLQKDEGQIASGRDI